MGLLGIVNNDIKRVIAYSTLSQLGYMTVALGASAYGAGDLPPDDARLLQGAAVPGRRLGDHRHAPRAGHAQDGRSRQVHAHHRGDLLDRRAGARSARRSSPASTPRTRSSRRWARRTAGAPATRTGACCAGVFVTALYTFRMLFMTFHGPERFPQAHAAHPDPHEEPTYPILLAAEVQHEEHAGPPHESPLVVTRAADRARHPLGADRRPDRRAAAVRRLLRRRRSSCWRATTCSATLGAESRRLAAAGAARASPGSRSASRSPACFTAWLFFLQAARAGRMQAARRCARSAHAAGQQVLLRLVQREGPRGAGARARASACGRAATRR